MRRADRAVEEKHRRDVPEILSEHRVRVKQPDDRHRRDGVERRARDLATDAIDELPREQMSERAGDVRPHHDVADLRRRHADVFARVDRPERDGRCNHEIDAVPQQHDDAEARQITRFDQAARFAELRADRRR